MPQYAERLEDVNDVEIPSMTPASTWAAANANGIVYDINSTTDANVRYIQPTAPTPRTWRNATIGDYTGVIVEYVGTRPIGR